MYTIMIVENEAIERDALKIFLNRNFKNTFNKIIEAKNGHEAIKKSRIYNPNLIIMNIEIPQINGIDTQKEILSFSSKVNTIFISAHSSFEYAQQALKLNVKDYLIKP
ncbi:response regulator, partial [Clostridium tarantellae]